MNKKLVWLSFLCLLVGLAGCGSSEAIKPEATPTKALLMDLGGRELRVGLDNEYPPFSFKDPQTNEFVGYDYDIGREICARLNCRPVFVDVLWDDVVAILEGQQEIKTVDIIADALTITPDRQAYVDFSYPYMQLTQVIMVHEDETRFTLSREVMENEEIIVGVQQGTTNYDLAVTLVGEEQIRVFEPFETAVTALRNKEIDVVLLDNITASPYLLQFPDQLKLIGEPLTREELGFALPLGSEWQEPVNKALADMEADGTLEMLFTRWFIDYKVAE